MKYTYDFKKRSALESLFNAVKRQSDPCVRYAFEQLDSLEVPFRVQNNIVTAAQDKRYYHSHSIDTMIEDAINKGAGNK